MPDTVLLVGGDVEARRALGVALERAGGEVHWVAGGAAAVTAFERLRPDAVVFDARRAGGDGVALDALAGLARAGAAVIVLVPEGDARAATRAAQLGAEQAVAGPLDAGHVVAAAARVAEKTRLAREATRLHAREHGDAGLEALGASPAMVELARRVEEIAVRGSGPVLITGEPGTGKGLVARLIHRLGPRAAGPFIEVSSAAAALEAELFGAETGAPGGPLPPERRHGLLELAHGGTAFFVELGNLAPELEPRLLELVERGRLRRQGATREVAVEARVVAASARVGRIHAGLFDRLRATTIALPPVRARAPEDRLALIARLQAELIAGLPGCPAAATSAALERLAAAPWPGNIRELRNALERAMLRARGARLLGVEHLPPELRGTGASAANERRYRPHTLAELERLQIERALRHHGGNRTHAARELGISRATLINKIRAFALNL